MLGTAAWRLDKIVKRQQTLPIVFDTISTKFEAGGRGLVILNYKPPEVQGIFRKNNNYGANHLA